MLQSFFFFDWSIGQSNSVANSINSVAKLTFRHERKERNEARRGPLWGAERSGATGVSGENVSLVTELILWVTDLLWPCSRQTKKKLIGVYYVAVINPGKASNFFLTVSKKTFVVTNLKSKLFMMSVLFARKYPQEGSFKGRILSG